ncbi:MAG TPA: hypothetical protein VHS28_06865 [Chloroflexota bacterium]|nr:hypothetical protein [Chloroflexota bacterium]
MDAAGAGAAGLFFSALGDEVAELPFFADDVASLVVVLPAEWPLVPLLAPEADLLSVQ